MVHYVVFEFVLFAVAFGCRYKNKREFYLRCPENHNITVTGAFLGKSVKTCWKECCTSQLDHLTPASRSHMQYLTDACNGHRECHVKVATENLNQRPNDYESVSYTCTDITPGTCLLLHSKQVYIVYLRSKTGAQK